MNENTRLMSNRLSRNRISGISLKPILRTLQFTGFYCLPLKTDRCPKTFKFYLETTLWIILFLIYMTANGLLAAFNMNILAIVIKLTGILNVSTLTSIVTGIKPVISLVHLFSFAYFTRTNRQLLVEMSRIDLNFKYLFNKSLDTKQAYKFYFGLLFCFCGLPMFLRIGEYVIMREVPGINLLADVSIILVPMTNAWNTIPLLYFLVLNIKMRCWFDIINKSLREDIELKRRRLRFYYHHFLRICQFSYNMGMVFNPFVGFTILWTVFTLCLSIYFVTQADYLVASSLLEGAPIVQIYFSLTYCFIQITVAGASVVIICVCGILTNESARRIFQTVLEVNPEDEDMDAVDRFQLQCFFQKLQMQHMWGVSVWWTVPIERSMLFTLVSLVMSYAFLLIKMKKDSEPIL